MRFICRTLSIATLVVSGLVAFSQLSTAQTSDIGSAAVPAFYAGQTEVMAVGAGQANQKSQPPVAAAVAPSSQVYDGLPKAPATSANLPRFVPSGQRYSTRQISNTQPVVAATEHASEDAARAATIRNDQGDDVYGKDADDDDDENDDDENDDDENDDDENDDDENDDDELQESITALDHVLESSTVKRILGLMAENLELRAEMRVQQMESKFQLQLMELKLDHALERLERAEDERMHLERMQDEARQPGERQRDERQRDELERNEREQGEREQGVREQVETELRNTELRQRSQNMEQAEREQQKMAAQMQQQRQIAEHANAELRASLKEREERGAQLQRLVDQLQQQLEEIEQRGAKKQ